MKEKLIIDEVEIPFQYEVCDRCNGKGTHVNPSIDGNGITGDEMAEAGPEFLEDYMSGVYDVSCYECHGQRVVMVPDVAVLTPEEREIVKGHEEYKAELRHEALLRERGIEY